MRLRVLIGAFVLLAAIVTVVDPTEYFDGFSNIFPPLSTEPPDKAVTSWHFSFPLLLGCLLLVNSFGYALARSWFDWDWSSGRVLRFFSTFALGYVCFGPIVRLVSFIAPHAVVFNCVLAVSIFILLLLIRSGPTLTLPRLNWLQDGVGILVIGLSVLAFLTLTLQVGTHSLTGHGKTHYAWYFETINYLSLNQHLAVFQQHFDEFLLPYWLMSSGVGQTDPVVYFWILHSIFKSSCLILLYFILKEAGLRQKLAALSSGFFFFGTMSLNPAKVYIYFDSLNFMAYTVHPARVWGPMLFLYITLWACRLVQPLARDRVRALDLRLTRGMLTLLFSMALGSQPMHNLILVSLILLPGIILRNCHFDSSPFRRLSPWVIALLIPAITALLLTFSTADLRAPYSIESSVSLYLIMGLSLALLLFTALSTGPLSCTLRHRATYTRPLLLLFVIFGLCTQAVSAFAFLSLLLVATLVYHFQCGTSLLVDRLLNFPALPALAFATLAFLIVSPPVLANLSSGFTLILPSLLCGYAALLCLTAFTRPRRFESYLQDIKQFLFQWPWLLAFFGLLFSLLFMGNVLTPRFWKEVSPSIFYKTSGWYVIDQVFGNGDYVPSGWDFFKKIECFSGSFYCTDSLHFTAYFGFPMCAGIIAIAAGLHDRSRLDRLKRRLVDSLGSQVILAFYVMALLASLLFFVNFIDNHMFNWIKSRFLELPVYALSLLGIISLARTSDTWVYRSLLVILSAWTFTPFFFTPRLPQWWLNSQFLLSLAW